MLSLNHDIIDLTTLHTMIKAWNVSQRTLCETVRRGRVTARSSSALLAGAAADSPLPPAEYD